MTFDCSGTMYATTGASAGTALLLSQSLLRVNKATGAAVVVCTFASTERVQVGAFMASGSLAHFTGTGAPSMELIVVSAQTGSACTVRFVGVITMPGMP